jgi:hypothetical protein
VPPSAGKAADFIRKVREVVDGAFAVSRATLERDLPRILARSVASEWTKAESEKSLSRTTLGP